MDIKDQRQHFSLPSVTIAHEHVKTLIWPTGECHQHEGRAVAFIAMWPVSLSVPPPVRVADEGTGIRLSEPSLLKASV